MIYLLIEFVSNRVGDECPITEYISILAELQTKLSVLSHHSSETLDIQGDAFDHLAEDLMNCFDELCGKAENQYSININAIGEMMETKRGSMLMSA